MTDFSQDGVITTLHGLHTVFDPDEYRDTLERRLVTYSRHLKICLLLPCLYSELENPEVMDPIVAQIGAVGYLRGVAVALGGAPDEKQFRHAREYFSRLATERREVIVVWVDGPRMQEILAEFHGREIPTGTPGKGQSVWLALGAILAREEYDVIALHDCDIVTYDRTFLGRLIEPAANPNNDFEFCKGYYARVSLTERAMKGRVTRLFVTPLLQVLEHLMRECGNLELERFFAFHRAFKYPLAGELGLSSRLARDIDIAADWGLEVSTLSEVYRRITPNKIAQVDLCPNYEHKHQELSAADASRGLHRMVIDIARFFLGYMQSHGVSLNDAFVDMLRHTYHQSALRFIKTYSDDAELNGLAYDRHDEELTAGHFRDFLRSAWEQYKKRPTTESLPSWNRICFSVPEIYARLDDVITADNR